jgi:hypothetical protein
VGASKVWSASNIPCTALETICDETSRALAALALAPLLLTFVSVRDNHHINPENPIQIPLNKPMFP